MLFAVKNHYTEVCGNIDVITGETNVVDSFFRGHYGIFYVTHIHYVSIIVNQIYITAGICQKEIFLCGIIVDVQNIRVIESVLDCHSDGFFVCYIIVIQTSGRNVVQSFRGFKNIINGVIYVKNFPTSRHLLRFDYEWK